MEIMFNSPVKEALRQALTSLVGGGAEDLYLVCAEYKKEGDYYTSFAGLEMAKQYADDPKKMVILMSFMSESDLFSSRPELAGILSYKNVAFLRLPPYLAKIISTYQVLKAGRKKEDVLGKIVFDTEMFDREVSILRHDLSHVEGGSDAQMNQWLNRAGKAGFEGTIEEIKEKVRNWKRATAGRFEGRRLNGIFVDFQGTLVVNGKLNEDVRKKIDEIKADKSVCVISASDPYDVFRALKGLRINYPVLSKFELKGATLEIVIDDFSEKRFRDEYGIIPETYIQV